MPKPWRERDLIENWVAQWQQGGKTRVKVFDDETDLVQFLESAPRGLRDRIDRWCLNRKQKETSDG